MTAYRKRCLCNRQFKERCLGVIAVMMVMLFIDVIVAGAMLGRMTVRSGRRKRKTVNRTNLTRMGRRRKRRKMVNGTNLTRMGRRKMVNGTNLTRMGRRRKRRKMVNRTKLTRLGMRRRRRMTMKRRGRRGKTVNRTKLTRLGMKSVKRRKHVIATSDDFSRRSRRKGGKNESNEDFELHIYLEY